MFIIVSTWLQHDSNSKYNHHTNGVYAFKGLQQRVQMFPLWCSTWKLQVKRCFPSCKSWSYESRLLVSGALGSFNQNTHQQTFQTKLCTPLEGWFFPLLGLSWANFLDATLSSVQGTQSKTWDFLCLKTWRNKRKVGEFNLSMLPQQKRQLSQLCQSKTFLEFFVDDLF